MYCKKCGMQIRDDAVFCRHCGHPVAKNQPSRAYPGAAGPYMAAQPVLARPQRSYTALRIVLSVLCLAMIGFGIYKVPGNIRAVRSGLSVESVSGLSGKTETEQTAQPKPSASSSLTEQQREEYSRIDAEFDSLSVDENGQTIYPEPEPKEPGHEQYEWFSGSPGGWMNTEEESQ